MTLKMEDLSPVKKKISFEIPWEEVKAELDAVYREVGKKAKVKGFRQGKVPRKVLEIHFKEQALHETANNIINKYYWQTLDEHKIVALSRPEIDHQELKENAVFSFSASFETEPIFDPQGYLKMDLEKEKIIITQTDLDMKINEIRQMYATMQEVEPERPVQKGDFVVIDFVGSINGETPSDLKAENYFLEVGSGRLVPGFEDGLIGMNKGQKKTIKVEFPQNYQVEKYAGKEISFEVVVSSIKEKKLPEFDEHFVKNFDRYNSLEELQGEIWKSLEEEARRIEETKLHQAITEKLLSVNEFEAPSSLVERQIFYMMADMSRRMTASGMDENSAAQLCLSMHDQFKEEAVKEVRIFLLFKKIAEKEAITVSDQEAQQHLQQLAEKHGRNYDLIRKAYDDPERMENLKLELTQKKVFDFIVQNANIKYQERQGLAAMEVKK